MLKSTFHTFLFGTAIVVIAVVVARVLRPVINYFENFLFERQTSKRVAALRDGAKGAAAAAAAKAPIRVRQTDITAGMSREDRSAYKQAESLAAAGQVREAAQIFERIKFQRKAIDLLEAAGMIDEACGVLIRLKAVGRAGVVFERNKMYDKAAHCFTEANQHEAAGRAYLKLGSQNFRFYVAAMDAFGRAERWDSMLAAAAEVLATGRIIDIAFTHQRLEFLAGYMAAPTLAQEVLAKLDVERFKKLLAAMPLTPRHVVLARVWVKAHASEPHDKELLTYVHRDTQLCAYFWTGMDSATRDRLSLLVAKSGALTSEAHVAHRAVLDGKTTGTSGTSGTAAA